MVTDTWVIMARPRNTSLFDARPGAIREAQLASLPDILT